ncbi:MAG: hypothetical protein EPN94_12220, partial [Nitrospirae bacterium]
MAGKGEVLATFIAPHRWLYRCFSSFMRLLARKKPPAPTAHAAHAEVGADGLLWALGSFCAIHYIPFDAELALKRFP